MGLLAVRTLQASLYCASALVCGAAASAAELACPPSIEFTPAVTVVDPPAGWQARPFPEMHFLSGARLFDGDPAELVELQEDEPGRRDYGWTLDPPEPGRSYMLVCTYEGTEMTFIAAVPREATRCDVTATPDNSRGVRYGRYVTEAEQTEVVCR